ncbi:MAG TPA: 3-phosphoshikimate 1-carboxyvinyltransferase [Aequorivita sp.]|nr:3-phosphoshikimate 1-carboxyvinyltransferase [Aequorivita sp.]
MRAILKRGGQFNPVNIKIGGSKSESNRLLILQALYPNITIENLSESDDTEFLRAALNFNKNTVDVHHAGTGMRFLTAYFAAKEEVHIRLVGSNRMHERPIRILVDALKHLGADIEYLENEGFPPLMIRGKRLLKNEVKIQANVSSQYISALMLIAPKLSNGLKIHLEGEVSSLPYIEMTASLLRKIGVDISFQKNTISIEAKENIPNKTITVESDWSSASYFYSLVSLSEDMEVSLENFSNESLQGDRVLVDIYRDLGVETVFNSADSISLFKNNKPISDALVRDLANTPDLAQTIAVNCFGLGIGCKLTGLHTLKIKETDRLLALKTELEKLGAIVYIDENSLQLEKSSQILSNKTIETYQDHRMAMAFAPLVLKTDINIDTAEVVSKSYPNFWNDLKNVGISCLLK